MHTQMRKSPRGEKESGKEMRRERDRKEKRKELIIVKEIKFRKKEKNKFKN